MLCCFFNFHGRHCINQYNNLSSYLYILYKSSDTEEKNTTNIILPQQLYSIIVYHSILIYYFLINRFQFCRSLEFQSTGARRETECVSTQYPVSLHNIC
jgi:hypothetical protein